MSAFDFNEFLKGQKSLEQAATEDAANDLANVLHSTYVALKRKGFTSDQAFELTKTCLLARSNNAGLGD